MIHQRPKNTKPLMGSTILEMIRDSQMKKCRFRAKFLVGRPCFSQTGSIILMRNIGWKSRWDKVNGNGTNRLVVNEDDHVHRDWELVRSSSCGGDFEVVDHDGESVQQESRRGGRVKDYGEGDGNVNEGAIGSTNDTQVLPMEPLTRIISNDQVVIRVTYEGIRSLSQGTEIWVTGRSLPLGVITGPAASLSGLADRIQSYEDEKVSHWDDLSDDSKEAACKQMAERQNDRRQRNSAGNRQGPSDKNVNLRGTSSGSRAPSHEDASRANVGASRADAGSSQPRKAQGCKPLAPSTSVNPRNQFNPATARQVPPGMLGPPVVAPLQLHSSLIHARGCIQFLIMLRHKVR
ncbi:hypothetical protein AKJ16_DCAP09228 [Drosera capensis]